MLLHWHLLLLILIAFDSQLLLRILLVKVLLPRLQGCTAYASGYASGGGVLGDGTWFLKRLVAWLCQEWRALLPLSVWDVVVLSGTWLNNSQISAASIIH